MKKFLQILGLIIIWVAVGMFGEHVIGIVKFPWIMLWGYATGLIACMIVRLPPYA